MFSSGICDPDFVSSHVRVHALFGPWFGCLVLSVIGSMALQLTLSVNHSISTLRIVLCYFVSRLIDCINRYKLITHISVCFCNMIK